MNATTVRHAVIAGLLAAGLGLGALPATAATAATPTPASAAARVEVGTADLMTKADAIRALGGPVTRATGGSWSDEPTGMPFNYSALRVGAQASAVLAYQRFDGEATHLVTQRTWAYPSAAVASRAVSGHIAYLKKVDLRKADRYGNRYQWLTAHVPGGSRGNDGYRVAAGYGNGTTTEQVMRQGSVVTVLTVVEFVDAAHPHFLAAQTNTLTSTLADRQKTGHGSSARTPAVTQLASNPIRLGTQAPGA